MSTLNAQFSAGHFHHSGFPIESGYGMPDEYTEDMFGGRIRKSEEYRRPTNTHQFDKHRFERYSSASSTRAGGSHWTGSGSGSTITRDSTGTAVTSVAVTAPTSISTKPSASISKSWRDRDERARHLREKEERRRSAAASTGLSALSMPGVAPVTSAAAYYPSVATASNVGSSALTAAGTTSGRSSRYMARTGVSDDVLDWRSAAKRVTSDHSRSTSADLVGGGRGVVSSNHITNGFGADDLWADHIDDGTLIEGETQGEAGDPSSDLWWYLDPKGMVRGPFTREQMALWFDNHYFHKTLPVCCADGQDFIQLQQWFSSGNPAFLPKIPQVWPVENEEVEVRPADETHNHDDQFSEDILSLPESSEDVDTLEPGVPLGRITGNSHDSGHLGLDFTDIVHSGSHHLLGGAPADTSAYSPSHESSALIGAGAQRHAAIQSREEGVTFDEMLESTAEAMNYWVSADAPLSMDKSDKSGAETPGGFTDSTAHAQQIPLPDSTHHFGDSDIGLTTTTHIPSMADESFFDPVMRSKSEDQPDSSRAFGHDSAATRHQRSMSLQGFQPSLGETDPIYGLSDNVWRDDTVDFPGGDSGGESGLALDGIAAQSNSRRKPPVGILKDDQHQSDGFEDVSLTDLMSGLTGGTPPIPSSTAALADDHGLSELDMGAVPSIVTTSSTTTSSGEAGVMISTLSDPPTAQSSRPVALKQAAPKKPRTRRRRKTRTNRNGNNGPVKSPTGSDGVLGSFSSEVRRPQLNNQKGMQKVTPLQRETEQLRMRRASATSTRSAGAYPPSSMSRPAASKTPTVVAGAGAKSVWGAPPSSRSGMIAHTGKRASMPGRLPSNQMNRARGMVGRRTSESAVTPSSVGPSPQRIRRQTDPVSMTPSAKKTTKTRTKSKNNSTKPVSSAKKSASLAQASSVVKKGGKKASKSSGTSRLIKSTKVTGVNAGKKAGRKKPSKTVAKSKSKSLPPAVMSEDFRKWCATEIRNIDSTLNAKVIVQLLATCNDEASLKECAFDIFGGDSGNAASFLNGYMLYRRDCSTGHSPAPSPKAQKKRRSGSKR